MTTPEPTTAVWAVDVLSSAVSLSRVTATDPRPAIGMVPVAPAPGHEPRAEWTRLRSAAAKVVEKITAGEPGLVVLAKAQWGAWPVRVKGVPTDSTAQRRLQLQAYIEDGLHAANIPVAEFPYSTALLWAKGGRDTGLGTQPMKELTRFAAETWGIKPPRVERDGVEKDDGTKSCGVQRVSTYRVPVTVLAAIGAMAAGIPCGVEPTPARLDILRGKDNGSVKWPRGFVIKPLPAQVVS